MSAGKLVGPAIVVLAGIIMLSWSWGTWPDPVVDFGREVYVPWQLSQGKILYRDIVSYFNGPLTPYLHAMIFRIFGVSLHTLVWFNLLIVAILATLLYRLIAQTAGHIAATASGVAFFVLFAFAQFLITGNYNYVCPYSYELPHGITLSAAGIFCLARWHSRQQQSWLIAAGALLGLVFLTKAEIFFAAAVAMTIGLLAEIWIRRIAAKNLAIFIVAAMTPIVIAIALLMVHLSFVEALSGIAGAWKWTRDKQLLELPFFSNLAGTKNITASLTTIFGWSLAYLGVFGVPMIVGILLRQRGWVRAIVAAIVFVVWLTAGLYWWRQITWDNFVRPMPLVLSIAAIVVLIQILRRKTDAILPLVLLVWAIAMTAKMILNLHIFHYGFALAMPATLMGVTLLLGWLPMWIDRVGGCGWVLRSAAMAALCVVIWAHGHAFDLYWSRETTVVGSGGDAFYADARGVVVNAALKQLDAMGPRDATLVVVPEGLMINYLSRRENPTGQLNFTPPAIVMYGEDPMLAAIEKHPPDFVMLSNVDTAEYGARFFGEDYGRRIGAWLQENYLVVSIVGGRPFREAAFGIVIQKRKSALSSTRT